MPISRKGHFYSKNAGGDSLIQEQENMLNLECSSIIYFARILWFTSSSILFCGIKCIIFVVNNRTSHPVDGKVQQYLTRIFTKKTISTHCRIQAMCV